MKGDSGLTKAERELIAVVVSVTNECAYCIAAHSAALRKLTKDPHFADVAQEDYTKASLEPRLRVMLDYAVKLTRTPQEMSEADVDSLREAGWTDEDIMDIAEVTAMFNLSDGERARLGAESRVRDARPRRLAPLSCPRGGSRPSRSARQS